MRAPPYLLTPAALEEMRELTRQFALELGVVGLMNVQYAIKDGIVYVLEVNPRASRTVPLPSIVPPIMTFSSTDAEPTMRGVWKVRAIRMCARRCSPCTDIAAPFSLISPRFGA